MKFIKALSVQQPWAWLIVQGWKDIENRKWRTKFRGRCLIHASKKIDQRACRLLREKGYVLPKTFKTGGIVGETEVVDCVTESCSPWFEGPYGFVLKKSKPLPFKPCKGMLNFFNVPISMGDSNA